MSDRDELIEGLKAQIEGLRGQVEGLKSRLEYYRTSEMMMPPRVRERFMANVLRMAEDKM